MRSVGVPICSAILAWWVMWVNSPCTGTNQSAWVSDCNNFSHAWRGRWRARPRCPSAPPRPPAGQLVDHLVDRMLVAGDGVRRQDHHVLLAHVEPAALAVAISVRADIASPCEPVEMTITSPGSYLLISSMSINAPSGMCSTLLHLAAMATSPSSTCRGLPPCGRTRSPHRQSAAPGGCGRQSRR